MTTWISSQNKGSNGFAIWAQRLHLYFVIAKAKSKYKSQGEKIMATQATPRQEDRPILTGMFRDRESTEGAYKSLRDRGYTDDEINVMMSDETRDKYYSDGDTALDDNKALEGLGTGSAIGGTLGAIIGGIAAIGTNVILPGLGLVVWGPIAAALAGAGAGGLTGGLVGALIGWGIPEERAQAYETGIREGGTVLGVNPRTDEDAEFFENEWRTNYRGEHVYR